MALKGNLVARRQPLPQVYRNPEPLGLVNGADDVPQAGFASGNERRTSLVP